MKFKSITCFLIINLFILLFTSSCFAANSYIIKLQMIPMSIHDNGFYIQSVMDGRTDKSNFGIVQMGAFNKKVPAVFADSIENTLQSCFDTTFKKDDQKVPITVRINRLQIKEWDNMTGEHARAEAQISFYRIKDEKFGEVFETEKYIEKTTFWDVTKFHEENIRKLLEQCFLAFINSDWEKVEPVWEDPLQVMKSEANSENILSDVGSNFEHTIAGCSAKFLGVDGVQLQYEWANEDHKSTSFIGFMTASGNNSSKNVECNYYDLDFGRRFYFNKGMDGFYWGFLGAFYILNETRNDSGKNESFQGIGTDILFGDKLVIGDNQGVSLDTGLQLGLLNFGDATETAFYFRLGYTW